MQIIERIKTELHAKEAFASFRFPAEEKIHFIDLSNSFLEYIHISNLSPESEGFIFAPFDLSEKLYFFNTASNLFSQKLNYTESYQPEVIAKADYIRLINKTISEIKSGKFTKIVISKTIASNKLTAKTIPEIFMALLSLYPNAFVSLVSLPNNEIWIGASPELLLQINDNIASTMALAGTKLKNDAQKQWTAKEIEEQKIVEKYILKTLQETRQKDITVSASYSRHIGNLSHLCSDFTFSFNNNLISLLTALHPTPAVCGLPKNKALDFIRKNENRRREFYAGFLGTLNIEKQSRLYVNLRNLKLTKEKTYLYVGGGITFDSDAEKEWEETENKSKIMLAAIKK